MNKCKLIVNSSQISNISLVSNQSANQIANFTNGAVATVNLANGPISGLEVIEVKGGHIINVVNKSQSSIESIVTNGTMNYNNKIKVGAVVSVEVGVSGIVNFTGKKPLIKQIDIKAGSKLTFVEKSNRYQLNAVKDFKGDHKDLKLLFEFSDFMHSRFDNLVSDLKSDIDYHNIAGFRAYHKLCDKLGKETVQGFVNSKETVVAPEDFPMNNTDFLRHILTEKKEINFKLVDQFINKNYFEFTSIAKDPLKEGFNGRIGYAKEILEQITSYLDLNDVELSGNNILEGFYTIC